MEDFCGTELWNSSYTWNTTDPDFTPCFEKTVLVWIPCAFLWILAPLETYIILKSKDRDVPWSWVNVSKLVLSLVMIIDLCVLLFKNVQLNNNGVDKYGADFMAPALLIFSMILQAVFVFVERRRGMQRSGVLFIFWLLMLVCMLPPFRTHIKLTQDNEDQSGKVGFVTFMIFYPLVILLFLLNCFGDKRPTNLAHSRGTNPCPEQDSSFLSYVTFSWLDGLIWRGYRKPLEQGQLWYLPYAYRSEKIVREWDDNWSKTMEQSTKTGTSSAKAVFSNGTTEVQVLGTSPNKDHYVSIAPTIARTFGKEFLFGAFLKLASDILQFVAPQILRLLIQFTEDPDAYSWKGYLFAVTLFVTTQVQSIVIGQYFVKMFLVGLKIRTAVVATVYKKALKVSNSARKESTVGEIVNLMSVDAQRFMDLTTYINMLWSAPLQIFLSMFFLWKILGPSALAGLGVMIVLIPINAYVANLVKKLQSKQMKEKDQRVKQMNEILNGMKVLKLYAWEPSFEAQVLDIRAREIKVLKKAAYLNATTSFIWTCAPFMMLFATFFTYTFTGENHVLTPEMIFVSISLINVLRTPLAMLPMILVATIQAKVSLQRMNKFMNSEELDPNAVNKSGVDRSPILVQNGTFAWDRKDENPALKTIDLSVERGSLVGVVGSVGAGKSSLCSALLGEMEKISGKVAVKGSVAYVAQQAWIQNATVKNNILFGLKEDESRYQDVIESCALKPDIEMLAGGDETEIGEKGINLSGGQKQRVSLGRAVYSDSEIYLLDDPLSAVDSHVGKHIFDKVIGPKGMLKDKTRILVTHGLTYLRHMDHIVVLKKGEISEQGSYQELMAKKGDFQEFLLQYLIENPNDEDELEGLEEIKSDLQATIGKSEFVRQISRVRQESECSFDENSPGHRNSFHRNGSVRTSKADPSKSPLKVEKPLDTKIPEEKAGKKLIEVEKAETGKVSSGVYGYYIRAMGVFTTVAAVFFYAVSQGFSVGSNVWLSEWSEDPTANETSVRNKYLGVYGALGLGQGVTNYAGFLILARGCILASVKLHRWLLSNLMRNPMSFYDSTPLGRILNRVGKDMDVVDNLLPSNFRMLLYCICVVIATLAIICYTTPTFILVMVPTMALYYFAQILYVSTSRQLKRIESVSRSPIYSHFGETVQGAVTIRAYDKCDEFITASQDKVDFNQVSYYPSTIANRWLAIRLEFLGNVLTFAAAVFAVLAKGDITGGDVGLSISYALQVTAALNWLVRMSSDVESNIVSAERIKEYTETEPEAAWEIPQNKPPKDWPQTGKVEFNNYSARYREGLDLVVQDINCAVSPTEKIGIVGRTGAGKSSLTLGLFRIIEPATGAIVIDGVDIARLGLHDLRSKITVIPQDPVLFSGTLRVNLDPFNHYSDDFIWNSLEHAHLKDFVKELPSGLQHEVSEGGENLSVGQRQLVCLARALLRKTKILVLDEATAAVDMETDDLIQQTIRREFNDCTVLTIAHRLNTIMDSTRVLVLDKGRVKEFASPKELLADRDSIFYSMAKDAGLV